MKADPKDLRRHVVRSQAGTITAEDVFRMRIEMERLWSGSDERLSWSANPDAKPTIVSLKGSETSPFAHPYLMQPDLAGGVILLGLPVEFSLGNPRMGGTGDLKLTFRDTDPRRPLMVVRLI